MLLKCVQLLQLGLKVFSVCHRILHLAPRMKELSSSNKPQTQDKTEHLLNMCVLWYFHMVRRNRLYRNSKLHTMVVISKKKNDGWIKPQREIKS